MTLLNSRHSETCAEPDSVSKAKRLEGSESPRSNGAKILNTQTSEQSKEKPTKTTNF